MTRIGLTLRRSRIVRIGLAVSFLAAVFAVISASYSIKLLPPGISKKWQGAGAHTQILVDDRKVSVLENNFDMDSISDLDNGAMLAGTVLAGRDAQQELARLVGIPVSALSVDDPQDPILPALPGTRPATSYSVTLAPRPNIPILDLYAHAPTEPAARKLADESVVALADKLQRPGGFGLTVVQLGHGARAVAAAKQSISHTLETFIAVFALGMALTITIDRMRGLRPVRRRAQEVASS
jgi:hypothetical protein